MSEKEYKSFCCRTCGECIGWIGRFFQLFTSFFHKCKVEELKYGRITTCIKCKKDFNMLESIHEMFPQYVTFKCPSCEQVYARIYDGSWMPKYVLNNDTIIKIKDNSYPLRPCEVLNIKENK